MTQELTPCWWFDSTHQYPDVRQIVLQSYDLSEEELKACLINARARARVFKPSLVKWINRVLSQSRSMLQKQVNDELELQRHPPPVFTLKAKRIKKNRPIPTTNCHLNFRLSEEDVWQGASTWWQQASVIRRRIQENNYVT